MSALMQRRHAQQICRVSLPPSLMLAHQRFFGMRTPHTLRAFGQLAFRPSFMFGREFFMAQIFSFTTLQQNTSSLDSSHAT